MNHKKRLHASLRISMFTSGVTIADHRQDCLTALKRCQRRMPRGDVASSLFLLRNLFARDLKTVSRLRVGEALFANKVHADDAAEDREYVEPEAYPSQGVMRLISSSIAMSSVAL